MAGCGTFHTVTTFVVHRSVRAASTEPVHHSPSATPAGSCHVVTADHSQDTEDDVGHPRFVVTTAWRETALLTTEHGPVPTMVRWRLLSGNNRQLGRSPGLYDDVTAAHSAAQAMRDLLDVCEPIVVRLTSPSRWVWSIMDGPDVLAVSGRAYEMERLVIRALDLFLTSAALAHVPLLESFPRPRGGSLPSPLLHLTDSAG